MNDSDNHIADCRGNLANRLPQSYLLTETARMEITDWQSLGGSHRQKGKERGKGDEKVRKGEREKER